MGLMCSMWILSSTQQPPGRNQLKCKITDENGYNFSYETLYRSRTYPVYAVGDYAGGQQYYATTSSNFTAASSSSNGNANSNSYIVPVDDAILGVAQSRGSPQTISTVSQMLYFSRFEPLQWGCEENSEELSSQDIIFIHFPRRTSPLASPKPI